MTYRVNHGLPARPANGAVHGVEQPLDRALPGMEQPLDSIPPDQRSAIDTSCACGKPLPLPAGWECAVERRAFEEKLNAMDEALPPGLLAHLREKGLKRTEKLLIEHKVSRDAIFRVGIAAMWCAFEQGKAAAIEAKAPARNAPEWERRVIVTEARINAITAERDLRVTINEALKTGELPGEKAVSSRPIPAGPLPEPSEKDYRQYFADLNELLETATPLGGFCLGVLDSLRQESGVLMPRALLEELSRKIPSVFDVLELADIMRQRPPEAVLEMPFSEREIEGLIAKVQRMRPEELRQLEERTPRSPQWQAAREHCRRQRPQ